MKKALLLLVLCLLLLGCTAHGEEAAVNASADALEDGCIRIAFEDGFSLQFPEDWQYYAPDEDMRTAGIHYCLSNADGSCWLYIGSQESALEGIDALHECILSKDDVKLSGVYSFGGVPFVVYDLAEGDVSCCAALLDGKELFFRFTPQSDSAFMALATQIMYSFALV